LAYQTAYLKVNYPIEFMCCLLSSEIENSDKNLKLNSYLKEAKRMNIPTIRTHINKSSNIFVIEKGKNRKDKEYEYLRAPFSILKGIGHKAVKEIVNNQPYNSLEDFMRKTDSKVINKTVLEALINSHCMTEAFLKEPSDLLNTYPDIKKSIDKEKRSLKKEKEEMEKYEGSLFDEFDFSGESLEI
jgi:DNA polymerase-3 subunit alpha